MPLACTGAGRADSCGSVLDIQRIGTAAKEIAEHAGRTQPSATDVLQALGDLVPAPVGLQDLLRTLETAKRPFPRGWYH